MRPEIEDYLNGEMGAAARQSFESEMAAAPGLREEVDTMRPLVTDLRTAKTFQKIEVVAALRSARLKTKRVAVLLFAGVFFAGALVFWKMRGPATGQKTAPPEHELPQNVLPPDEPQVPILEKPEGAKPQILPEKKPATKENRPIAQVSRAAEIAKSQYSLPPELANLRGEKDENLSKIAKLAFEEKQFDAALDLFDRSEIADSGEARFLRGHLFFAKNNFFRAYEIFNALAAEPKFSAWKDSAEWYAVLAGLAAEDRATRAAAGQLLDKILVDGENPARARKAKKLKELMD